METKNQEVKALIQIKDKENIFVRFINRLKTIFSKAKLIKNMENKIEMVIFDLDGTLWNTEDVFYEVTKEVVQKYNFLQEISKESITKTMGYSFSETAEVMMPYLEREKREEILQEILDNLAEKLTEVGGNVYEGLEDVLKELKKDYMLAIVSNCAGGYIESFLDSANLRNYFADFAAAAKMGVTKAEAIKAVIRRNNIKKAVYIGDTIKDFEACKTAEIQFIQAKYGFGEDLNTEFSLDNITELPDTLDVMLTSGKN